MQSHRGCTRQTIRLSVAFSTGVARSEHREGRGDRPGPGIQFNTPTANRYGRATRKSEREERLLVLAEFLGRRNDMIRSRNTTDPVSSLF